jgi:hypothetical protein
MFISDTTSRTVVATEMLVLLPTKLHTLEIAITKYEGSTSKLADATSDNAIELQPGLIIEGKITSIKLHSGAVMLR